MMRTRPTGFTLIELVAVMIIIGILAVAALPRFYDLQAFDTRGFYDQTQSILRYAQKAAIVQRRLVCVGFAANSVTLTIAANAPETSPSSCSNNPLTGPAGAPPYMVTGKAGVAFFSPIPSSFNFNALGQPVNAATGTALTAKVIIQISGAPAINVEPETGYVH